MENLSDEADLTETSAPVHWREAGKYVSGEGIEIPRSYVSAAGKELGVGVTRVSVRAFLKATGRSPAGFEIACQNQRITCHHLGSGPSNGSLIPIAEVRRFLTERGVPLPREWQGPGYRPPVQDAGETLGIDGFSLPRVRCNHRGEKLPASVPRIDARRFFLRQITPSQFEGAIWRRLLMHMKLGSSLNAGTIISLASVKSYAAKLQMTLPREWDIPIGEVEESSAKTAVVLKVAIESGASATPVHSLAFASPENKRPARKPAVVAPDPLLLAGRWAICVQRDLKVAREVGGEFAGSFVKLELGPTGVMAFVERARELLPGMEIGCRPHGQYHLFWAERANDIRTQLGSPNRLQRAA